MEKPHKEQSYTKLKKLQKSKFKNRSYTLIVLLTAFLFSCACKKNTYTPDNELIISVSEYDYKNNLPSICDTFYLRIERMNDNNFASDNFNEYLFNDSVLSLNEVRFKKEDNLNFGRYVISCTKDTLKDNIQVLYKGGSIHINLLIK